MSNESTTLERMRISKHDYERRRAEEAAAQEAARERARLANEAMAASRAREQSIRLGAEAGKRWAEEGASYEQLLMLAEPQRDPAASRNFKLSDVCPPDANAEAFAAAAKEVWTAIKDRL